MNVKTGAEARERFEEATQLALTMEEASPAGHLSKMEAFRKQQVKGFSPDASRRNAALLTP